MSITLPFDTVSLYSKDNCPWCDKARDVLTDLGINIEWERKIGRDITPAQFKVIAADYHWHPVTVPLIFYKKEDTTWALLGGFNELEALVQKLEKEKGIT